MVEAPLLSGVELLDFPGAPFPLSLVLAAAESVRSDAGWHIAPAVAETVLVDGSGAHPLLLLPTLRIVSVSGISVYDDGAWLPLLDWRVAGSGMLYRTGGWPYGIAGIQVTMTHGFDVVPDDLLPVIAARCQRSGINVLQSQRSETTGPYTVSESFNTRLLEASGTDVGRYKLPNRVA